MIQVDEFIETLHAAGIDFFTGVPDSLLKSFCAYLSDRSALPTPTSTSTPTPLAHVIAANEGGAVGLAADPSIAVVYTTHHETGSGVLNPIRAIGASAHAHGATFIVDTTSSYAMIPIERGMDDALVRCRAYVKAGADGIMIHSRKKDPAEILAFCDAFRVTDPTTPIVVVPTSFNSITEAELAAHGVNICIYANQLTRAAFPAMQSVAEDLLRHHRALEVDSRLLPFRKIITLIDG